jgi:hypothetical protein
VDGVDGAENLLIGVLVFDVVFVSRAAAINKFFVLCLIPKDN